MDFVVGLLMMTRRHDYIFVVMDTLNKSSNFIPIKTTYKALEITVIFIDEIVKLHEMPTNIISNRGVVPTKIFWTSFQEAMGTQLKSSMTYLLI